MKIKNNRGEVNSRAQHRERAAGRTHNHNKDPINQYKAKNGGELANETTIPDKLIA